jgi:hypothetical protein
MGQRNNNFSGFSVAPQNDEMFKKAEFHTLSTQFYRLSMGMPLFYT